MGLRITTWNVNGIRNPFGYQPWRDKRSFSAMFDVLEADIVVFQETKIQRKDLSDDMVLVPGWDCYFSLPRHKKGYSGVVIYTRQSVCAPIRAEEGITGLLCPPNSTTSFLNLPDDQQIGGYPTSAQLASSAVDANTLDSEGRCVILEFPAFVLLGVYSPANRDEARDEFRLGFLDILDARIRNLVALDKRVFLTGDLNISREELDAANAEASMRKQGMTGLEFVSTPARRLFNHLLEGGKVFGDRDEGREQPVMWDICRAFHPERKGMFTCWEQKVNARPGNCGARIDYVLCSLAMKSWFADSNIQEGLMGSDHCPVYAVMQEKIFIDGEQRDARDVMNPPGMFIDGKRQRDYSSASDPLPMSGKLIPEFFGRRNIRDMFARKPFLQQSQSIAVLGKDVESPDPPASVKQRLSIDGKASSPAIDTESSATTTQMHSAILSTAGKKRSTTDVQTQNPKRTKSSSTAPSPQAGKGQQSLKGFFRPKSSTKAERTEVATCEGDDVNGGQCTLPAVEILLSSNPSMENNEISSLPKSVNDTLSCPSADSQSNGTTSAGMDDLSVRKTDNVHDAIESKESWSKLFTKPAAPRCEGHNEPCITLLTKKAGMNLGRSFWMCPRPLGPSGAKEKNTQWRCQTFIWCSDWNPNATNGG